MKINKKMLLTPNKYNMETKTNAIVVAVIVVIFLFIAVIYKIKSDKKRKSLAISSLHNEIKMNCQAKSQIYGGFQVGDLPY